MRNMRLTTNKTGVVSWRMTESSDLRNVGSCSVAALRLLTWLGENSRNTSRVSEVSEVSEVWSLPSAVSHLINNHLSAFVPPGGCRWTSEPQTRGDKKLCFLMPRSRANIDCYLL